MTLLIISIICALGVAGYFGFLYSKAKKELVVLQELNGGQAKVIKAFGDMLELSKEGIEIREKIKDAKTLKDLEDIYNSLIE